MSKSPSDKVGEIDKALFEIPQIGDVEPHTYDAIKIQIQALLHQKQVEARIDELNKFSVWINKGMAETHRVRRLQHLRKQT